jgi:hypothetical protein
MDDWYALGSFAALFCDSYAAHSAWYSVFAATACVSLEGSIEFQMVCSDLLAWSLVQNLRLPS